MTRYDAIRRQLGDIEKHHERALEKRDMQVRVMAAYRDQLEAQFDIAVGMIASAGDCSEADVVTLIVDAYEVRQAARKVATA